jgi:hypothetical protein
MHKNLRARPRLRVHGQHNVLTAVHTELDTASESLMAVPFYDCSEAEQGDPRLVAPSVPEPYVQRFMVPRTNWVNIANGTEPAPGGDAAAALWQTHDRHNAGSQP